MKTTRLVRLLSIVFAFGLGVAAVRAADLGEVKQRMEQRQPTVDALKDRRVVGENNRGYLEARASLRPEE